MVSGRLIPFAEPTERHSRILERPQIVVQIGRDDELLRLRAQIIGCCRLYRSLHDPGPGGGRGAQGTGTSSVGFLPYA